MIAPLKTQITRPAEQTSGGPRAHLIGVAGAGMQALAEVLWQRGWQLTATDVNPEPAAWLLRRGVRLFDGHDQSWLDGAEQTVIYSAAVPAENRERRLAARLGLAQRSYPQAVADLMRQSRGLAVAGTHGKSTTVAMIAEIMTGAGLDPTVICGAAHLERDNGGRAGRGEWMVAEACEYRAHFLGLAPEIATILNIEPDHFDCFRTADALASAFTQFTQCVRPNGVLIANADCPATRRVAAAARGRLVTFGLGQGADWRATHIDHTAGQHRFCIQRAGREFCRVDLAVPGRHQVANALAAAAAANEAGATASQISQGLARFRGLRRRLERVASCAGVELLDDYAHHPTEVSAALSAVRQMHPARRVWCIFQPHQVSRTLALVDEFAASLQNADRIAVAEVFPAREIPTTQPLAAAERLAARTRSLGAAVLPTCRGATIVDNIATAAQPGDVVITLGAGDIRKRCNELADRFRAYCAAG